MREKGRCEGKGSWEAGRRTRETKPDVEYEGRKEGKVRKRRRENMYRSKKAVGGRTDGKAC